MLSSRHWQREDKLGRGLTETHHERYETFLLKDGSLIGTSESWSEMLDPSSRPAWWENPRSTHEYSLGEEQVIDFDFEPKYYRTKNVITNRDRSDKLLVDAKGVGLSKALEKLLEAH